MSPLLLNILLVLAIVFGSLVILSNIIVFVVALITFFRVKP